MNSYTLARSGDRAIKIEGERIAQASSRGSQGPAENRWYELALYGLTDGRYAIAIGYRSQWQGELSRDEAQVVANPENVAEVLRGTIVGAHMIGFPPGREKKAAYVQHILQAHYDEAVSEVLGALPSEEAWSQP